MTEVDYSPEAYNRYMQTRQRVGSWAVEASACADEYTHPFDGHQPRRRAADYGPVPVVRPDDSISLYEPPSRRRERSSSRERSRGMSQRSAERPVRPRAMTAPHGAARPAPAQYYVNPPQAQPASNGYRTIDLSTYRHQPGGEIRLPPPRPGESYKIIPPKGKRIEVVQTGHSSHPYAVKATSASASAPTSPTHHPYYPSSQPHAAPPHRSTSRSLSPTTRVPVSPTGGYFYTHSPAHPSPLHVTVPQAQYLPHPAAYAQEPSPSKKKQAPLLKRLLTSHVTWDARKPQPGRRLSD